MQRDFKYASPKPQAQGPRPHHWFGAAAALAIFAVLFFPFSDQATAKRSEATDALDMPISTLPATAETSLSTVRITQPLAIPGKREAASVEATETTVEEAALPWQSTTVKSGDSLALIFARMGLSPQELDRMMRSDKETASFKRLMPGQKLDFQIADGQLQQLIYKIDALNTLKVLRNPEDGFSVNTENREMEVRVTNTSGTIDSSLFLAGQDAGMSDNLIMELAGIFGWDIDFVLDIRSGDQFTVVYEEQYLDGQKQGDGNILAAEFTNRGKTYRALRYTDASGRADYYTPDGKSMRKAFIRTPVDFTRISSRFGKRLHPTLGTMKNHHGVDYAAPTGTPIKAAGDGKIVHIGRKGGYGKTIIIQHGGKYSTLYAHMSSYNRKLRVGSRIRQGQIIGYVGSTGRSTGPHLHYEFRINGVHRNPLTVRLPDAAPIAKAYETDFNTKARGLVALLDVLKRTTLASNSTSSGS